MASQEKFAVSPPPQYTGDHQQQHQYPHSPSQFGQPEQHNQQAQYYNPHEPQSSPQPHQQQQPYTEAAPMAAAHQPHQQAATQVQPMAAYGQQGGKWQAGLCDCGPCDSCLLGTCLPCILVGQTSERMRDPSGQTHDSFNSDCIVFGLIHCFTGCGWIYGLLKRGEIREKYNIEGGGTSDCCTSYWCLCCALIQQDNEVKLRQKNALQSQQYQSQPGMHMPAPEPAHHPQH
ncbi:PLAC8 family-domain-containing protein [Xylariaceae sp. FL1272]|nr:PLAC8 family-domain-containing protein [Xylariaceae sp. FL1272]